MAERLDREAFLAVVRDAPLVSIDLIVEDDRQRVLLGMRTNAPARGSWFVPGGRIAKDERLAAAFARITAAELGTEFGIDRARPAGVWEHLYDDNALGAPGISTHYVVLAYRLPLGAAAAGLVLPDDQHTAFEWWSMAAAAGDERVHANTRAYFEAPGESSGNPSG